MKYLKSLPATKIAKFKYQSLTLSRSLSRMRKLSTSRLRWKINRERLMSLSSRSLHCNSRLRYLKPQMRVSKSRHSSLTSRFSWKSWVSTRRLRRMQRRSWMTMTRWSWSTLTFSLRSVDRRLRYRSWYRLRSTLRLRSRNSMNRRHSISMRCTCLGLTSQRR